VKVLAQRAPTSEGWYWVTGEPFAFAAWSDYEPKDYVGSEDGLRFAGNEVRWNDADRTSAVKKQVQGFLVEYDVRARGARSPSTHR
jgi:hypothetical protein